MALIVVGSADDAAGQACRAQPCGRRGVGSGWDARPRIRRPGAGEVRCSALPPNVPIRGLSGPETMPPHPPRGRFRLRTFPSSLVLPDRSLIRSRETTKAILHMLQSTFLLVRTLSQHKRGIAGVARMGVATEFRYSHSVPVCFFWVRHSDTGCPTCWRRSGQHPPGSRSGRPVESNKWITRAG